MEEERNRRDESYGSVARLEVSTTDLSGLGDRLDSLQESIMMLERDQMHLQERISELRGLIEAAKEMYTILFAAQLRSGGTEPQPAPEHTIVRVPEQITLGITEVTRERILSVLDAIRRVSEESQGPAPTHIVESRAEAIGISKEDLAEVLGWLRRAGALRESKEWLELI
jgi:exonuclease VII small subunit